MPVSYEFVLSNLCEYYGNRPIARDVTYLLALQSTEEPLFMPVWGCLPPVVKILFISYSPSKRLIIFSSTQCLSIKFGEFVELWPVWNKQTNQQTNNATNRQMAGTEAEIFIRLWQLASCLIYSFALIEYKSFCCWSNVRSFSRCYLPWNSRKERCSFSLFSVKNVNIVQL